MPGKNLRIDRVVLYVADLDRCVSFYETVVGLKVLEVTPEAVDLGTGSTPLLTLVLLQEGHHEAFGPGLYHVAFRVPTRSDLGHWLLHFSSLQHLTLQGASDHAVSEALYLADPEGNGIEIYWDRPYDTWPIASDGRIGITTKPLHLQSLVAEVPSDDWKRLPDQTDIGHIHLQVSDLTMARRFYVDLLGMGIKSEFRDSALFVAAGTYHHHLGLNTWNSSGAPPRTPHTYGLKEAVIHVGRETDLEGIRSRLLEAGYPFEDIASHTCFVEDPGKIRICLTCHTL